MGVSYRTIKDWWRLLKDGPFFCEQIDRGRRGWVVRMADDWVDWHVMSNNYPEGQKSALDEEKELPSRPAQGQENDLENRQGPVKAPSRPDEGQKSALETPAYKEDHHDQESGGVGKNQNQYKSAPAPFFQKLAEMCSIPIALASPKQKADLGEVATALCSIGATVEQLDAFASWWWSGSNWRTRKAKERGDKPEAPRPREVQQEWGNAVLPAANGHKPTGRGPPQPTAPAIPADAHSTDTAARKLTEMIREQRNRKTTTS